MSTVTICTDSSALLTPSAAASLGVEIAPIAVALDGEPFDELTSSLDWFYERMRAGAKATTSQPSIGELATVYERAVRRGAESIVSIHLDARISGTISCAEAAAAAVEVPVLVVDTRTVSYGVGLCVRAAAAEVAARGRAGDAGRASSRLGAVLQNGFVVRSGPGGRIAPDEGWTVYRYEHGAASRISVCATLTEAVPALLDLAREGGVPICVAIGHAGREIEPAANELDRRLRASGQAVEIERYRVGASVGAHTGPDSFGLFWWPAP